MQTLEIRKHTSDNPWTYAMLDAHQREIAKGVLAGEEGRILLSEVAPVITMGRRTKTSDILLQPERLQHLGIQLLPTDRGGLATYHGPGQWVLFTVDTLEALTGDRRGVYAATEGLLNAALEVGREYFPEAEVHWGAETGVWSSKGKFAAVGIHIEKRVLLHGVSLNVYRTPLSFTGLRPCGLDAPVAFLLGEPVSSQELRKKFDEIGLRLVDAVRARFWKHPK